MLDAIVELIHLGASNSLQVFCFCNLIIAILLVSNWKPSSVPSDDYHSSSSGSSYASTMTQKIERERRKEEQEDDEASLSIEIEVSSSNVTTLSNSDHNQEVDDEDNGNIEEEDEDEDELRRRIEEFIEKVNRGWRAEKLGASPLFRLAI